MMKTFNSILIFSLVILIASCSGGKQSPADSIVSGDKSGPVKGQAFINDDVSNPNILQIAAGSEDHTTLVAAVLAAGLENVLANNGPLTVFAPNNAAFEKLPKGTVENLLKPENKSTLAGIITYHAAPGTYRVKDFKDGMELYQATGGNVKIGVSDGKITVNGANLLASIEATNGIVHVIDAVLIPPE